MSEEKAGAAAGPSQRTLAGEFTLDGTGLHSGRPARAICRPAPAGTGIVFRRSDLPGEPLVPADVELVSGVEWETVLGPEEQGVRTVEHLLAAVAVHSVDNIEIVLEGAEPPALDGSALPWCREIQRVGVRALDTPARLLRVRDPFTVCEGAARYTVMPADGYRVSAEIDFEHPVIGREYASCRVLLGPFCEEIAPARTFGLESWAQVLHARGLALGASYENTVVLTDDGLVDGTELRFDDEFVRHKILDIVGDLALTGARLECHVVAERPSHRGNVAVARRLRHLLSRPAEGGALLEAERILDYLPHRYPFLLVDRILEFEPGKRILGLKNVTINEPFFAGHFPGHPIMPGVLIIEGMAQAGGLLLMNQYDDPSSKVVYFMSLDEVKFRRPVRPGDQLHFELEMLQFRGRVCRMRGLGTVDGQVVAEATMMAQVVDR